jgi:hypothetical protein
MSTVAERPAKTPRKGPPQKPEYVVSSDQPWATVDGEGIAVLTRVPDDFNPSKQKALKKEQFASKAVWYDYSADLFEKRAASYRKHAADERSGLSKDQRKATASFEKLMKRVLDQRAILSQTLGEDKVNEMLAAASALSGVSA